MTKKPMTFWQMFNLNFGFLGIQFGWGLQMANMSGIYKFLGANAADIGYLWIAAPLTGLLIQPILGMMSDKTWTRLGRRRPYILAGAIAASLALVLMPNSVDLWMAASLLWVLDGSVNIAMQPYRALVADVAPDNQHTKCYAIQSGLVGIGAFFSSALPWIFLHIFHLHSVTQPGEIPLTIRLSFYIGAGVFMLANIWTTMSSKEYPPEDMEKWHAKEQERTMVNMVASIPTIIVDLFKMPKVMLEISFVQFFSWLGLFCVFLYFGLAMAQHMFHLMPGVNVTHSAHLKSLLEHGIALGGLCFAIYNAFSIIYAFLIPYISKLITRKGTHILSLLLGAASLISCKYIHNQLYLFIAMAGLGAAWASVITIPFAMLAASLPEEKTGVYMGLFNMTVCIPEIIAALALGFIVHYVFHYKAIDVIELAGVFFILAAVLTIFVHDKKIEEKI